LNRDSGTVFTHVGIVWIHLDIELAVVSPIIAPRVVGDPVVGASYLVPTDDDDGMGSLVGLLTTDLNGKNRIKSVFRVFSLSGRIKLEFFAAGIV